MRAALRGVPTFTAPTPEQLRRETCLFPAECPSRVEPDSINKQNDTVYVRKEDARGRDGQSAACKEKQRPKGAGRALGWQERCLYRQYGCPPSPGVTRSVVGGCVSNSTVFTAASAMAGGLTARIYFAPEGQMVGRKYYINFLSIEISPNRRPILPKFRRA